MSTLNTNALVNQLELQAYLGARALGGGTNPEDLPVSGSRIQSINQASQYIQSYIGYNLFSGSLQRDIFDGRGYNTMYDIYHDKTQVSRIPVVGAPLVYYRCSGDTWTLSTYSYSWDSNLGTIWLTDSNCFDAGTRNWKVEYAYGFTSITTVPSDLKLAACMIAQYVLKIGEHGQFQSATIGDINIAFSLKIPQDTLNILNRYEPPPV